MEIPLLNRSPKVRQNREKITIFCSSPTTGALLKPVLLSFPSGGSKVQPAENEN